MNYQDGYSQKALDALAKGKYKSLRSSGLANYRYTEGKKKRDNAVAKQNKKQNPTPRNTNAMANDPRFFAPSVSLPVPTLPMVNAMQGDPRFQVQPEYNGDEVLNQLLGGVKSSVKESPNLSDMIPGNDKKVKSTKKEQKQTDKVAEIMGSFDPTTPVKVTKSDEDKKKRARAIQYQQNLADREQSYKYNPIAKGANTLDEKDLKFMDDVFENFGDEFAVQAIANSDKTKDWERKYGKSFEQIYADYLADRRNRLIEQGEESPVSNWLYTVADKTLRTPIAAVGDFVSKVVSPDTAMSKRADAIRHQVEDDIKLRRAGIKENTGDFGDKVLDTVTPVADRMVASNVDKLFGLGGVFTGLSDYSNQMEELNMRPDMTEREKALDAGQHGLVEGLGTAITRGILDKTPSANGLWGNLLNVGKGAGNAAFENTISEIVEMGLDSLFAGDNSQKELNKQLYMLQGMDEKQAENAATMDQVKQAGTAAGTGALFGGATTALTQAAKGIANAVPDLKTRLTNAVVDKAKSKKVEANDAARLARAEIEAEAQANVNRVPDVVENARAQAERAQAEIESLNEQLPKAPVNEVAANDTGIESNPTITERYPFPEKADGSRPDYHNVEEVGTRLETTRQSIAKNNEDIEVLNKQLNDIPDLKKNAKERSALKNQIYQLEQQNKQSAKLEKILTKISEGKQVSNKDIFEVEFPDDYHAIFDGRGGFFGRLNMATKFAGDTPEAKALAQSIRDDIYSIAKGDFDSENLGGLLEKVYNLDRMAKETKAEYRSTGTGNKPSRVYKYDDFFAGTKNGIGDDFTNQVIHSLDKAYQVANNMTGIDTAPRVTEAAGESAPVETPESVVASSNPTVPEATGIDNRVPTQTPVEINRVPAVEQTTPANGDEKIRSFSERGSQDDTLPDEIRESLSEDKYRVVRNADVETRANELFDPDNLIQSRSNLKQAIDNHDPAAALLSYKLAKAYVDSGEYDAATDVIKEASAELTKSGQFTQAAKLAMMQNDPMAAMRSYMRDLEDLNKWGKKKYGKKWKKLELSEEDVSEFGKVTPGDAENLNNLVNKLNKKFGKEVHASFWDKAVGATKTSMLLNMRTQMRNIVSNTAMLPVRSISDRVSALGQNVAHLINPNIKVTQSLVGGTRAQKQAAGELFESMKDSILGTNKMKDSNTAEILGHRQIFNDDFFARWIDNKTNGGIQKLNERLGADGNQSTMETLQNFTYWLMGDFGDTPFVKKNFENRLASYMKAQNIDNIKDVPDDAIALAIEESLKATFKDDNAFTKALQGVKQKTGKFGEIALPFVKTPANLAMRSIDYSPIGLINTFRKAKNGAEVNQVIDELAKNLTGTAMIYLGYKLREKGLLSGNYSEDKDEAAFQKQQGMLEHAFHIGDKYFTYDWLQPAAAPLEIGSVIYDAINNSDEENAGVLDALNSSVKGGLAVANSWIQSSPLQSLSDMLGNNPYGNEGVAENVLNEVIEFPQRLIPAQLGAIARSVDPTIRDTYIKDNTLTGIAGNQARQIVAKIPYLSKTLPASYDTWGNERTRTDTKWGGALAQNVNPGQLGNKNETPLDSEIQRLFDVTGRGEVFPISASRSLTLGEETVNMTNKEHSEYQKMMGEQSYEMADAFMNSAAYKDMTDEERVNTLDSIYKLSNSIAKEKIFNYTTDSDRELKEIYKTKGAQAAVDYLTQKSEAKNLGMSFSTYQKKEAEYEGGAEQYAQDKQTALDNGFVKSDGTANPDQYKKVMAQAGEHADKVLNDIPTLQSSGLPTSSYYTYAQAVNVVPSLSPSEFASTYKAIDTNPENAITQTEILEYINKKGYSQDQLETVQDLWDMYKPSNSKKVPYLKDGIWKAKSK